MKYLPEDHAEFPALLLGDGDMLFNRTNSPELVGKTAVARGLSGKWSFASYLIRVRFADGVIPEYVSHFINSPYGRRWVAENVSQQVGQANVNGTKLRALTLPLPPTETQKRIVDAVERALDGAAALANSIQAAMNTRGLLERSLLNEALAGQLPPPGAETLREPTEPLGRKETNNNRAVLVGEYS